jgi:tRNA threonylcarbamoyladenosine biosynthesis protein TsaE
MKSSKYITYSSKETQKLGGLLAKELKGGAIICLSGDLGSGKTTFAQGLLKSLGAEGPYTSPTFLIMKHYRRKIRNPKSEIRNKFKIKNLKFKIFDIYHIDAYRVKTKDVLNLGWDEIIADKNNIVIIEWAERICDIIPSDAIWIKFEWKGKNKREITFK